MSREAEKLEEMRRHPVGWRYAELTRVLRRAGFTEISRKGSHRRWKHPSGAFVTLVDAPGDVLAAYVRQVVSAIARSKEMG